MVVIVDIVVMVEFVESVKSVKFVLAIFNANSYGAWAPSLRDSSGRRAEDLEKKPISPRLGRPRLHKGEDCERLRSRVN